jgi:hypothetical protein
MSGVSEGIAFAPFQARAPAGGKGGRGRCAPLLAAAQRRCGGAPCCGERPIHLKNANGAVFFNIPLTVGSPERTHAKHIHTRANLATPNPQNSKPPKSQTPKPPKVIKVRLMAKEHLGRYKNTADALAQVLRVEGPAALFIGLAPTLWRNCVWNSIFYGTTHEIDRWRRGAAPARAAAGHQERSWPAQSPPPPRTATLQTRRRDTAQPTALLPGIGVAVHTAFAPSTPSMPTTQMPAGALSPPPKGPPRAGQHLGQRGPPAGGRRRRRHLCHLLQRPL